jgi:hypothetical protein
MILPNVILKSKVNQHWAESGMDSSDNCLDKKHFAQYPHTVSYKYNSRGFRDAEWPDTIAELQDSIWCIGDSFTVGIGSPLGHTWPYAVCQQQQKRTINVSMDGASNEWIARKAIEIHSAIKPDLIIIMWSYVHRREKKSSTLNDEERRIHYDMVSPIEDIKNFLDCINHVDQTIKNCIHFVIPGAASGIAIEGSDSFSVSNQAIWNDIKGCDWPELAPATIKDIDDLPMFIIDELNHMHTETYQFLKNNLQIREILSSIKNYKGTVPQLDLARDGHHFDILSSQWVAKEVHHSIQCQ